MSNWPVCNWLTHSESPAIQPPQPWPTSCSCSLDTRSIFKSCAKSSLRTCQILQSMSCTRRLSTLTTWVGLYTKRCACIRRCRPRCLARHRQRVLRLKGYSYQVTWTFDALSTPWDGVRNHSPQAPSLKLALVHYRSRRFFSAEEEIYTHANAFIPERWYLYPDMIKEKSAWAPFSAGSSDVSRADVALFFPSSSDFSWQGPSGCIGRNFALMNLRTTVARLVMIYDFRFPEKDDDNDRLFEAKTKDHFTLTPPELRICFEKRRLPKKWSLNG